MIEFTIPMRPKPAPRPRTNGFMPRDYVNWKTEFALRVPAHARKALEAPVSVFLGLDYAMPKLKPKSVPAGDCDNLSKGCLDGLTDAGVWKDDRWVVELHVCKGYAAQDGIRVVIKPVDVAQS